MKASKYVVKSTFPEIGFIQEAVEITYSATYETETVSVINITETNSNFTLTDEFRCQINIANCVELITFLKEKCVYPVHGKDIVGDLGYKILSPACLYIN